MLLIIQRQKSVFTIFFFFCFAALVSCTHKNTEKASKKIFRYNEAFGIATLDPAFAKDQSIIWACNQLFNGLVQMDSNLNVQPCIAKRWEISNDGLLYTFYLRNDVYFHDNPVFTSGKGRLVVVSDFIYSLGRILDPKVASPGAWVFGNVEKDSNGLPLFTAINDTTLTIKLKQPFPPFLGLLTMQYCSVVPKEAIDHFGKDFRSNPIGTGPFQFKFWREGIKLVLHKNQNYFEFENGKRLPNIDAVSISFINDRQLAFMDFLQGKLDMNNSVEASYKDELLTKKGVLQKKWKGKFKMEQLPYLNTEYLGFMMDETARDSKNALILNKEVRQAINYGFDRERMVTYLRNSKGSAGKAGMVPAGLPSKNYEMVKGYTYNPQKAKELLQQAGVIGQSVILSTTSDYVDLCEYIQSQLAEIGLKIKVEVNQSATHREMISKQKLAFFRGSWIADYPDAENYLALFYSKNFAPNGPNYTHFKNTQFDRLYELSLSENDTAKRYSYYRQMDSIVVEEAPVVPLYYDKAIRLYQNNISGIKGNAMNLLILKNVCISN